MVAGRGYGYVAVSRFRRRNGVYLYGKLRRTDFLPGGEPTADEVLERGYDSASTDSENGGLEYAFPDSASEPEVDGDHSSMMQIATDFD